MIKFEKVSKKYGTGSIALDDITLAIDKGEFAFLVGPSGSGKTTMLRLLIRDMLPSEGVITINEIDIARLSAGKVPQLRKKIGVVFQDLKLLMDRTVFENIILPLEMANVEHKEAVERADAIMKQVAIAEHRDKFPIQLSGGELQRVAIARALIFSPAILLADEPTGNLDTTTSWEIIKLLQDINTAGTTVLMATHNLDVVNSLLKRVITLEKGRLVKDERKGKHKEVKESKEPEGIDDKEKKEEASSAESDSVSDPALHSPSEASKPKEDKKK